MVDKFQSPLLGAIHRTHPGAAGREHALRVSIPSPRGDPSNATSRARSRRTGRSFNPLSSGRSIELGQSGHQKRSPRATSFNPLSSGRSIELLADHGGEQPLVAGYSRLTPRVSIPSPRGDPSNFSEVDGGAVRIRVSIPSPRGDPSNAAEDRAEHWRRRQSFNPLSSGRSIERRRS